MRKITKDGRVILSLRHYRRFRQQIYDRCLGACESCSRYIRFEEMELHHIYGRGGGKRTDTDEAVQALCRPCHEKAVIKRREPVNADASGA